MKSISPINNFSPLVIGAPRTGFSLMINVISHLYALSPGKQSIQRRVLKAFTEVAGGEISRSIVTAFGRHNIKQDLIYNDNFRDPAGGPKWLDPENTERACFRKYIGVKGLGDFTLITTHPWQILDNDEVVHSHYHPKLWLEQSYYSNYRKFASIRNPVGTLNSSCFSINALTSEYIQKFIPSENDNDDLRQHLALYKLTDMDFFIGLIKPLKAYLEEFMQCQSEYTVMRWEDLITLPIDTISKLSQSAGIEIDIRQATTIWDDIKYKNLTAAHKHNYRKGHGKVEGWRQSLTNEHLAIMREHGLEEICQKLGYGKIVDIDESTYTEFQKKVSTLIAQGKIFNDYPDRDLFDFAFNKSNLDSEKFSDFKRYDWREHTQIERSCFTDKSLLFDIWDVAETAVGNFNQYFKLLVDENCQNEEDTKQLINKLFNNSSFSNPKLLAKQINEKLENKIIDPPRLILREKRWSIVAYGNVFYGVAKPLGHIDIADEDSRKLVGISRSNNLADLIDKMSCYTSGLFYWCLYLSAKWRALFMILNNYRAKHV